MRKNIRRPEDLSTLRFEYKYHLDPFTYYRVTNALRWVTRHDRYSRQGHRNRYFVRSLYFDTFAYHAYQEKITGVPNRIKLRFRTYSHNREGSKMVNLELKTRFGDLVAKFSDKIPLDEYDHFLSKRAWIKQAGGVPEEFRRITLLKDLSPMVLVDYRREALLPIDGSGVRITFDHSMRFALARELFPSRAFFHTGRPKIVVMEIKVTDNRPKWLEDVVKQYGLKSLPNSKYAWGIEHTQHGIFY